MSLFILTTSSVSIDRYVGAAINACCPRSPIGLPEDDLVQEGDLMLGFLFPLSTAEVGRTCGSRVRGFAVQGAQSALYLIDKINKDPNILPNLTLGYAILNDCGRGKVS